VVTPTGETAVLVCHPGGEPVETTLTVEHTAPTIDRLTLRVDGLDPAWCRVAPQHVVLRPGEHAEAHLTFAIPAGATGGSYPSRALAVDSAGRRTVLLESTLEVSALTDLLLEVLPYRQRARGAADFRVRVRNAGNTEQVVRLFAAEPGATLRFTLRPEDLAVAPGEERLTHLRVTPTGVSRFGRPRSHVFWAGALPFDPSVGALDAGDLAQPLAQAGAELLVVPRWTFVPLTGRWLLRIVPALLILLAVILVLILRFWPVA
jgi:hypothetical protein